MWMSECEDLFYDDSGFGQHGFGQGGLRKEHKQGGPLWLPCLLLLR